ncbi:hypothetical protein J2R99_000637 [Rhodopseudomonas julia]|uniref:NrtR DNA-binding winged helix domain-containing protein n=1 Tax=Rhodopseudomonas julia TaxID=200617 RepID=A0ABU0C3K8_9BRAD|nr:NAD regulator [Rhodopseudomonas julia]MDQ0324788.1 hypothetical protein [Rhodopseudomonas julia]
MSSPSPSTNEPARIPTSEAEVEGSARIEVGLNAAIVAVDRLTPLILVVRPGDTDGEDGLPFGPFDPVEHRTMEIGLRAWVAEQTRLKLGYVEQLYTFGDRGRHARRGDIGPHVMTIGYLALTRRLEDDETALRESGAQWRPWYAYFPWEDWRQGRPAILDTAIEPLLKRWCAMAPAAERPDRPLARQERVKIAFGWDGLPWDEERVLERYELLYEAGLVLEAGRDGRQSAALWEDLPRLGRHMRFDHRRILATAIGRLRGKLKYRPLIFELIADSFTLTELQKVVEAISGRHLHKQNFRRLVEQTRVVEQTGETSISTGGRPAALFRFRRDIMKEGAMGGLRLRARL